MPASLEALLRACLFWGAFKNLIQASPGLVLVSRPRISESVSHTCLSAQAPRGCLYDENNHQMKEVGDSAFQVPGTCWRV